MGRDWRFDGKRWPLLLSFALLVAATAVEIAARPAPITPPSARDQLLAVWPRGLFATLKAERPHEFRAVAERIGPEAARAILDLLIERNAESDIVVYGDPESDEDDVVAWTLGEMAETAPLLHALSNRREHEATRLALVTALSRPRHAEAFDALLDIALDRHEANNIRKAILLRLHRFERDPPKRLRDLLYQPFGDLDIVAAATLARMGDPEAPSLVRRGLERYYDENLAYHLAAASNRITGRNWSVGEVSYVVTDDPKKAEDEANRKRVSRHLLSLNEWIENHPGATEFERQRAAYRESEQRARELAVREFADILAAEEEGLDLAASVLTVDPRSRERTLDQLDRLAMFLRRKLVGIEKPEKKIEILNEWLLKRRPPPRRGGKWGGRKWRLPRVLAADFGNCLGNSVLYLAIAERLGLPIQGVSAPGHCFVRYEDEHTRRNIETTANGQERPDHHYQSRTGIHLRNLTKREMVGIYLSNLASYHIKYGRYDDAKRVATRALQLDPRSRTAFVNRAVARFHSELEPARAIEKDLRAAIELDAEPETMVTLGMFLAELGQYQRALPLLKEALERERTDWAFTQYARCLARMGRQQEALAALEKPLQDLPRSVVLRTAEAEARIRQDPADGVKIAKSLGPHVGRNPHLYIESAKVLVELGEFSQALELLDQASDLRPKSYWDYSFSSYEPTVDIRTFYDDWRTLYALRARIAWRQGRKDEAGSYLVKAHNLGGSDRYLMLVQRKLGR